MRKTAFLPAIVFLSLLVSCSSPSKVGEEVDPLAPTWVHQPARTMEGGYIIYVGNGEDSTLERAHFKAQSMALQDLVNECSMAPKGTRTEDGYDHPSGGRYRSSVKVAIEFQDCEEAKKAIDPEQIRKIANVQLTEQLKRYQDMMNEPAPEVLAANDGSNDESNSEGDQEGMNPMLGTHASPQDPLSHSGPRWVVIQGSDHYFFVRQQVAYAKQDVILSPPTVYAANTPRAQSFAAAVAPATQQIQQYEKTNPELRTTHKTYSTLPARPRPPLSAASRVARPARRLPTMGGGKSIAPSTSRGGKGGNGRGRGKKKRRWDQP